MRIVSPETWTAQPWRNGGGVTHEIVREGPPDGFLYRVSVADVTNAGPFSRFAGVDRSITLLEGEGFTLRFEDGRVVPVLRSFEPLAFSGDDAVDCTLVGGLVRDLNVMVDRARVRMEVDRLTAEGQVLLPTRGALLLVFVLAGALDVSCGRAARHALVVAEPADLELAAHAEPSTELLVARLHARVPPR